MNFEKYTQKSVEVVNKARDYSINSQNAKVDQQHLLYALLNQKDGAVAQMLKKLKINARQMASACDREVQRIPKVAGSGVDMNRFEITQALNDALIEAEQQAAYMKDEYVSVEHLMLGLIENPNVAVKGILNEYGLTREAFLDAMAREYEALAHNEMVIEFVPLGYSKGTAIREVCRLLGCSAADTVAFGDSPNDLPMFGAAGFSVALGDGHARARQQASFVTSALWEDGVARAIEHLGLL